jgi:hypothetical protein
MLAIVVIAGIPIIIYTIIPSRQVFLDGGQVQSFPIVTFLPEYPDF